MADGREHEQQLIALECVERVLRTQPAEVYALLAVALRLSAVRRRHDEEPGVEADLHLRRGDPARPGNERGGVAELESGLFLGLAHGGAGSVTVLLVDGAAGEDPRTAHEARIGVALHEQDLRARV